MDSPKEEKNTFSRIISVLGSSEPEVMESGVLSKEMIEQVSMHSVLFFFFLFFLMIGEWIHSFTRLYKRHQRRWRGLLN